MKEAGGMYNTLASHLNAGQADYTPTKAMEYVVALAVLLKLVGHVDDWVDRALTTVRNGQAINSIEEAESSFMCVWPSAVEPATDFGGRLTCVDGTMRAIIGQVKMQEPGTVTVTTQRACEVLDFAWFIGRHIDEGKLTLSVHAFFVSSREAQRDSQMISFCHAFRVAMAGDIAAEGAKELASVHNGVTTANTDVQVDLRGAERHVFSTAERGIFWLVDVSNSLELGSGSFSTSFPCFPSVSWDLGRRRHFFCRTRSKC
jgi:hypothetical protein